MAAQYASYKNLIVYKKAKSLTKDLILYFSKKRLPKNQEFLLNQLYRASSSVGANIAEGYGRHYQKSYRNFISIARGSSFEVDYWLELTIDLKVGEKQIIDAFIERNNEAPSGAQQRTQYIVHRKKNSMRFVLCTMFCL